MKLATYNVKVLLRDDQTHELDEELRETRLETDVIGIRAVRRREVCFTTLRSGHLLFYKGQVGLGFLIKKEMERPK